MDRNALGRQLFELRRSRGLTLRAAAAATGLSHAYIEAVEKGRPNANITLKALEQIEAGLGGRLAITLQDEGDELDTLSRPLTGAEREKLAAVARALAEARTNGRLDVVVDSAIDMITRNTAQTTRASG